MQKIATLSCRICGTFYQQKINKLTKEVDVYCNWIDEAEETNKQGVAGESHNLGYVSPNVEEEQEQQTTRPSIRQAGKVPLRNQSRLSDEEAKSEDDEEE